MLEQSKESTRGLMLKEYFRFYHSPLKDLGKKKDWRDPNSLSHNQKESMGRQDTGKEIYEFRYTKRISRQKGKTMLENPLV